MSLYLANAETNSLIAFVTKVVSPLISAVGRFLPVSDHSGVISTASVQLDELLVLVDGVQGAAHVVGDVSRAAGLDLV